MKQILVPTDLSVKSVSIIHEIVKRYEPETVKISLIHMVQIPSDMSELLFLKKRNLYEAVPFEFTEAMQLLRNKYAAAVKGLQLEFYYGNYAGALKMVIENLKIDEICVLENYKYLLPLKNSVNIIPFLSSCKEPVHTLRLKGNVVASDEMHLLSSLFVNEQSRFFSKEKEQSQY